MSRSHYEEVQCRTALQRVEGMPFRWSFNPYQGCQHGCHYCYARRYYGYLDLNSDDDWTSLILVKVNAPEVLRRELGRRSWQRERVAMGTATDCYQPIEGKYRLTRRCLEVFAEARTPVSIVTKGTLIVRDVDVLAALHERAGVSVVMSLTTVDPELAARLEPGVAPPLQRLRAMERLVAAGVPAGVNLAPIIPGLTDRPEQIEAVVRAAAEHGACFLGANVLHLKPGTREHFLAFLRSHYPSLLAMYERLYPGAYALKPYQESLRAEVTKQLMAHPLRERELPPSPRPQPARQMRLAFA